MKRQVICWMLFLLAALSGCASKSTPKPSAAAKPQIAYGCPIGDKAVTSMERLVSAKVETAGRVKNVKVAEMRCSMQGDRLRIDFTLQNSADKVRRVAYRFDWFDRKGLKAWSDEVWKPVYLYEESRERLVSTAPDANAVDFLLVLVDEDRNRLKEDEKND